MPTQSNYRFKAAALTQISAPSGMALQSTLTGALGTHGRVLIDSDVQDLHTTLTVNGGGISGDVTLAENQPNYAPAKAGDKMDIQDIPNPTAIAAIQLGLSKPGTEQAIIPPDDMASQATLNAVDGAIVTVKNVLISSNNELSTIPVSNASMASDLKYLTMMARNKVTADYGTTGITTIFKDDSITILGTGGNSDTGTTLTKGKMS
jgi:hypothetical protein